MNRRIFNAIAVVSAVLCVGTVVLWPLSYRYRFYFSYDFVQIHVGIHAEAGVLGLSRYVHPQKGPGHGWIVTMHWLDPDESGGILDFGHIHSDRRPRDNLYDAVWCPNWCIIAISGVMPTMWFFRFRRVREELLQGRCRKCGYDLRATPERCPECGTVPEKHEILNPKHETNLK